MLSRRIPYHSSQKYMAFTDRTTIQFYILIKYMSLAYFAAQYINPASSQVFQQLTTVTSGVVMNVFTVIPNCFSQKRISVTQMSEEKNSFVHPFKEYSFPNKLVISAPRFLQSAISLSFNLNYKSAMLLQIRHPQLTEARKTAVRNAES